MGNKRDTRRKGKLGEQRENKKNKGKAGKRRGIQGEQGRSFNIEVSAPNRLADMENTELRAVIKYFVKKGTSPTEIREDMDATLVESDPAFLTVKKWAAVLKHGRESVEDDFSRPVTNFSCAAQQLNASQSTHRFSFVNHTIKTVNMPKCAVSSTQKFLVQQHITTSKHQANKQLNSKQRQLFLTQPTTSNVRSEFNIDLCRSLISADIPLYKLKNKVFREFLEKYTQHTIPDESTLRKT
ncbi:hypothetical protein ANN_15987 [Periplaneta americana]|uniref:Mos1 transposase HTH domain-containing protein n=1 Tax=Periplaneta americana TaxID=6978 RepID=A0ABQ8SHQ9_PERAM|nr:hypothetical protein ANN_15987 [Periplaneta americana]